MNWRAYDPNGAPAEAFEAALYSDACLDGSLIDPAWPLDLMPANPPLRPGLKLAAVARVRWNATADPDMSRSDTGGYHGGGADDEVAALVSLALGVRCRSGGITRLWPRGSGDPLGMPIEFSHRRPYLPEPAERRPLLPNLPEIASLEGCAALFGSFAAAQGSHATALVRAARLYEHALWIAEDDPNLSWLQLVSALEVAAVESIDDMHRAGPGRAGAVALRRRDLLKLRRVTIDRVGIRAGW
jgi:hypothetical protein